MSAVRQEAGFVRRPDAGSGAGFRLVSQPERTSPVGTVVWVHAFAEEMNKSRRMAALGVRSGGKRT